LRLRGGRGPVAALWSAGCSTWAQDCSPSGSATGPVVRPR